MSAINWNDLAEKAANQTDAEFTTQLAALTSLKTTEVAAFIKESSITNANALTVLGAINNATLSNTAKAAAIANIQNGVGFLVQLVSKVV